MPRRILLVVPFLGLITLWFATDVVAQRGRQGGGGRPSPADAAKAAVAAAGLKVEVWAAEPMVSNPVAFTFDERGKCYIAETFRHSQGVTDTRSHMNWLDDDIGLRSVAERVKMFETYKYPAFPQNGERVKVLWDSTGSGKADQSEIFADGFNQPADGIGAGVLARKGNVFFTCIPDLYLLKDTKGTNKADVKQSLATGFGIHVQFIGHDLHGLVMGPDGKLYFSIGDRGFDVATKEGKRLSNPDSGAVLRCDPDGANLEIVHVGLRNPQELAFDDFGNLFTYDNNSDSGDEARWVQVVDGGDSGWRCGFQYGTLMHHEGVKQGNRGPWNTEKIWYVPGSNGTPPAYVVPPLAHFGNGPSGITHYPGLGLNEKYKDHFFACDFKATAGQSVIWSLAVKPKGASFEVVDRQPFVRGMVPTDCEFGPDGAFYWSDWIGGWDKTGAGRIFKVTDPEAMKDPRVEEARKVIAEGMGKKGTSELLMLLENPHQKVRQEAQFELVARGSAGKSDRDPTMTALITLARKGSDRLARIHAVWAVDAIQRANPIFLVSGMSDLIRDKDAEVRAQFAKVLAGWGPNVKAWLVDLLADPDPRVQYYAAVSYGRAVEVSGSQDYLPLFALLKRNADADPYLRHAAVHAMVKMTEQPCDISTAFEAVKDKYDVPAVRMGIVLALRRLQCRMIGQYLSDPDPAIAAEAARAICDQDLMTPMEDLAAVAVKSGLSEPVAYRAVNANFKLGRPEDAARIAAVAGRSGEADHVRIFALKVLADWAKPPRRDAITGLKQDLPGRSAEAAKAALLPHLAKVFAGSDKVRAEAVKTVAKLGITEVGATLAGLVSDEKQSAGMRVESLYALDALKAKELKDATSTALASAEPKLRAAARVVAAKVDPARAVVDLPAVLKDDRAATVEKQQAFYALGQLKESKPADETLAAWLDDLTAGKLPPDLALDLLDAARTRANAPRMKTYAPLKEKLAAYDKQAEDRSAKDPLARFRDVTHGGDAERGKAAFLNNTAVYCQRCHKFEGQGGEVGPELTRIGSKQTRDYIVEALVDPNKTIAKGFESVVLTLEDGRVVSGVLKSKTDQQYVIVTAEAKVMTFAKDEVAGERPDRSAMPDDLLKKLTRQELRDVVEFLAATKEPGRK